MSEEKNLSEKEISEALQGISIPPQPQVMVDLQMEQSQSDISIQRISELISGDVGLSGSILKIINSPFYGLSNKITSIQQACNLLGINSVINIVNALSIRGELSDENIIQLNQFWDSAIDIAMASTLIAKRIGTVADEAYTFGLFHNCGIPLMMLRFDDYNQTLCDSYAMTNPRIIDLENEKHKTNHAVVGYYIARSWHLPDYMCDAIAEHHSTEELFKNENEEDVGKKTLIAILKMAEHICGNYRILGNQDQDHEWQRIELDVLNYVGFSLDDFHSIAALCDEMGLTGHHYVGE